MQMISRIFLLAILLTIALVFASGCYTVLRHPDHQSLVADDTGARKACEDCHQGSRFYHDAFDPGHYAFGNYWAAPAWNDYYYRPWWFQDYWYYGHGGSATPTETGGQHLWSDPGRRAIGTPAPTPVITGGTTSGGTPTAGSPAPTPSTPSSEPKKEETRSTPTHRSPDRREIGTPDPKPAPPNNADPKGNPQPPPH